MFRQNKLGFIPTMGALHEGHLSLVRQARQECDRVVVSVFVNPTQFGPHEDFDQYPRNHERDRKLLERCGADEIWFPTVEEIYPEGLDRVTFIQPPVSLTQILCGRDRPDHFSGVATVVKRFFETVHPTDVYFGQKDYQQTRVIDWLIQTYFPFIRFHVLRTVRERDGLAMSSRNVHLSFEERRRAKCLFEFLYDAEVRFKQGECSAEALLKPFEAVGQHPEDRLLYAEVRDLEDLTLLNTIDRPAVLLLAVHIGKTRLIDNVLLSLLTM